MRSFKCSLLIKVCFASFLILGISSFTSSDKSLIGLCVSTHNKNVKKIDKKEEKGEKQEKGFFRFWRKNRKEQKKKSPATIKTYSTTRKNGQFLNNISVEMEAIQDAQKQTTSAFLNNRFNEHIVVTGAVIKNPSSENKVSLQAKPKSEEQKTESGRGRKKGLFSRKCKYVDSNKKLDVEKTNSKPIHYQDHGQYKKVNFCDSGLAIQVSERMLDEKKSTPLIRDETLWESDDDDDNEDIVRDHNNRITFLKQFKSQSVQERTLSEEDEEVEEVDEFQDRNSFVEEVDEHKSEVSIKDSIKQKQEKKEKKGTLSAKKEGNKSLLSTFFKSFKRKKKENNEERTKDVALAGLYYYEDLETRDSQRSVQERLASERSFNENEKNSAGIKQEIACVYCKKNFYILDLQTQKIASKECPSCGYKSLLIKKNHFHEEEQVREDEEKKQEVHIAKGNVSSNNSKLTSHLLKERGRKMFSEYKEPKTGVLFSQKMMDSFCFNPLTMTISDQKSVKLEGEPFSNHHWSRVDFKESGFSISLPLKPEHSKQIIEIANPETKIFYETYISEPNVDTVYVISVWEYPANIKIKDPEANLQEGFSGMLLALPESRVLLMKSKEVQGFHALEFHVKNSGLMFKGELISMDNILYQIFTVYKDSGQQASSAKKDYEHFIGSFKITHMKKNNALSLHSGKVKL